MKINESSETPFLTIGIASYNYAKYLEKAFDAIKRQKFTDYEILYCDDGSTDNSIEIIENFIKDNPQIDIRLIRGPNLGVMGNKNRILDNARGKYVMICDADDWMLDNCLEVLCNTAKETGAGHVVGAFKQVDENEKILQIQGFAPNMSRWMIGLLHGSIYRMDVIREKAICFDTKHYPDDFCFNMLFHCNCKTFAYINDAVYVWKMHKDSTSAEKKSDTWPHGEKILRSCLEYIAPMSCRLLQEEYSQIEYSAIKMYGGAILKSYGEEYGTYMDEYTAIKRCMEQYFPDYRKNIYANKIDGGKIVRLKAAVIMWAIISFEKIHVFKIVLSVYWLLSKFIFFP